MTNLGRHPLSNEEYEEYQAKEKQREAIMERNKKIKKKEHHEPLPFLDPIQPIGDGSNIYLYIVTSFSIFSKFKNLQW